MNKNMKRRFQIGMRILCGLSFLWLLGIAGGLNSLEDIIVQGTIAVSLFGITAYLGGLIR